MDKEIELIRKNAIAPKNITVARLKEIAESSHIDISGLKLKQDIYDKIRINISRRSPSPKRRSPSPKKVAPPKRQKTPGKKRKETPKPKSPEIQRRSPKGKSPEIQRKSPSPKRESPKLTPPQPITDGDILRIFNEAHPTLKIDNIDDVLEQLKANTGVNCDWISHAELKEFGKGASGTVFKGKDASIIYKISNYVDVANYLTIIFSAQMNKIVDSGITDTFMKVYHIKNCNTNVKTGDYYFRKPIVEIMEYQKGIPLSTFMKKANENGKKYIFAQIICSIMVMMMKKMAHFDLHDENIIVYKTEEEFATYKIGKMVMNIPTNGYKIKIIDYDIIGIVIKNTPVLSTLPIANDIPSIANQNIKKYPGFFMCSMFSKIFRIDHAPYKILENSLIHKFIRYIDNPNRGDLPRELTLFAKNMFIDNYEKYTEPYISIFTDAQKIVKNLIE